MATSFASPPVERADTDPVCASLAGGTPEGIAPGYGLASGEGPAWWFAGCLITMKARRHDTDGAFSLVEFYGPRGAYAPGHIHAEEAEAFFILEGALDVGIGDKAFLNATQGAYFYVPKKTVHEWRIVSPSARFLCWIQPGGFEHLFEERAVPAEAPTFPPKQIGDVSPEQAIEIGKRYGWSLAPGPLGITRPGG